MQEADPEQEQQLPEVQQLGILLFGDSVDFRFVKYFCEFALGKEPEPFTLQDSDWMKLQGGATCMPSCRVHSHNGIPYTDWMVLQACPQTELPCLSCMPWHVVYLCRSPGKQHFSPLALGGGMHSKRTGHGCHYLWHHLLQAYVRRQR